MLYSQGVPLEALGVAPLDGGRGGRSAGLPGKRLPTTSTCSAARRRGYGSTTSSARSSASTERLAAETADATYDHIAACLAEPEFRPRALLDRFGIEVITTTDSPIDDLAHHRALTADGLGRRVLPTFRPDPVVDPDHDGYADQRRDARRDHRARRHPLGRLPRRAVRPPRRHDLARGHRHRPRPSDGTHRRPPCGHRPGIARRRPARHPRRRRQGRSARPAARRDGAR